MTEVSVATRAKANQETERLMATCDYYGRRCKHINIYTNGERAGAVFIDETSQRRFTEFADWLSYVRYNKRVVYRGELAETSAASDSIRVTKTGKIFPTREAWEAEIDRQLEVPADECITVRRSTSIVFPAFYEGAGSYDSPFSFEGRKVVKSGIPEKEEYNESLPFAFLQKGQPSSAPKKNLKPFNSFLTSTKKAIISGLNCLFGKGQQ